MDSITEDRVGTLVKVNQFAIDNTLALAINPNIEPERVILETDTERVFQNDSIATRPLEGFTQMKANAREDLEDIVLLVRAGCVGYYTLNPNPGKLMVVKFPDSKVTEARDNDLYVLADQVHDIADPIKLLLAPFQVSGAQVDSIPTLMQDYKDVLQLPRTEEAISIAAGKERGRWVDKCFNETLPKIDAYMLPFKYTDATLFSKYETARAIDNSGGGSDSSGYDVSNYVLAPGETVSFGTVPAPDKGIYIRQIGGSTGVIVCEAALPADACAAGFVLAPAVTVKKPYGDLALSGGAVVNFTNPGAETVTVRAGLKV